MRQLLLMRHAKSSWDDPHLSDHARPLNARGRRAASAMAAAMTGLGLTPDVVLVSSARRTLQTLEALGPWDEQPLIEPMDALYLAEAERLATVLAGVAQTARSVLVLGHNPGLHDLALLLAAGAPSGTSRDGPGRDLARLREAFPTGALVEFAITGPWSTVSGGGRLIRFLTPADLPEMAA